MKRLEAKGASELHAVIHSSRLRMITLGNLRLREYLS